MRPFPQYVVVGLRDDHPYVQELRELDFLQGILQTLHVMNASDNDDDDYDFESENPSYIRAKAFEILRKELEGDDDNNNDDSASSSSSSASNASVKE